MATCIALLCIRLHLEAENLVDVNIASVLWFLLGIYVNWGGWGDGGGNILAFGIITFCACV